jgi:thymidylate synthase
MKMYYVEGETLPQAYHKALYTLNKNGQVYPCPDYNTTMKELPMTFYVEQAAKEPFISRLFPGGHHELQQYTMEICDGILDFMIGAGENVWEYTYHQRFAFQLPWIIEYPRF